MVVGNCGARVAHRHSVARSGGVVTDVGPPSLDMFVPRPWLYSRRHNGGWGQMVAQCQPASSKSRPSGSGNSESAIPIEIIDKL